MVKCAAVFLLESKEAGVDDFILVIVLERVIPSVPVDRRTRSCGFFRVGQVDSGSPEIASASSVDKVTLIGVLFAFPQPTRAIISIAAITTAKILLIIVIASIYNVQSINF